MLFVTWVNHNLHFRDSARALGLQDTCREAWKVHGGHCQITGTRRTDGGPALQAGPEEKEVNTGQVQEQSWEVLFLRAGPPNWTSTYRNQGPPATPLVSDLQPVFPGLTQLQGVATQPGRITSPLQNSVSPSAKLLLTGLWWGSLDAVAHTTACGSQNTKTYCPK